MLHYKKFINLATVPHGSRKNAERIGELATEKKMLKKGWTKGADLKIRGKAGQGKGNQGIDQIYDKEKVISRDRHTAVELKSKNKPDLNYDTAGIQQASKNFNQTRLERAMSKQLSSPKTIKVVGKYLKIHQKGHLESFKALYDPYKKSIQGVFKLFSDFKGDTVIKEVTKWIL